MTKDTNTASIIMAAGRGSRMKSYDGNKTLLPLIPGKSLFEGSYPVLLHILKALPAGPKALVVNYKSEDIKKATQGFDLTYWCQPKLNGTGGAILAVREFIENQSCNSLAVTMGDVPFIKAGTYDRLLDKLDKHHFVILGFVPEDKKRYGVLEIQGDQVKKITEWKYWKDFSEKDQKALTICNSGIYAVRRKCLLDYLPVLESRPQIVHKERNGEMVAVQEYFLTDIVEYMNKDNLSIGYVLTDNEMETMGIDDPASLEKAQQCYKKMQGCA
ncbi:NTP transferase domain-containing protein, MobA-like [Desulfonema limicola]|uniref:NTP transferase domain-containing protein, MobA-like n=1 Tax=Desulfonema limicola TaxID=45656 RepID=A0A975BC46_9BACT|nr:NTP transferase domain-containing protein [Desulfonema limicola]QTA82626.1 NTP transferase domain-containing protein, MobA-like [Desulfonema limicola]